MDDSEFLLSEQAAYYRARAAEYDEWWQRQGRYDHGEEATRRWHQEVAEVAAALERFEPTGAVLELACGTGWWTERLARRASALTCVDVSPETLAINRERLVAHGLPCPSYVVADLFAWQPESRFDVVFFSFWLSHVPPARLEQFWGTVAQALNPGGRVFFVDSRPDPTSSARDHRPPGADGVQERKLNDGRSFRVIKMYRQPDELAETLGRAGWTVSCRQTAHYFVYGEAMRS